MENHSYINNQFVPYELAVKLKELGFDEECLGYYRSPTNRIIYGFELHNTPEHVLIVKAPLWQQAFDWFTRKGLHSYIEGAYPWFRYYINTDDDRYEGFKHLKIEEARLECLKKLIQILEDENK